MSRRRRNLPRSRYLNLEAHLPLLSILACDECGHVHDTRPVLSPALKVGDEEELDGSSSPRTETPTSTKELLPECMVPSPTSPLPNVWLRLPNTAFGIPFGLAGHAIMWNGASAVFPDMDTQLLGALFWTCALVTALCFLVAYVYKALTQFDLVRDEFRNPGRLHFFNAPHLLLIMLTISVPERYYGNDDGRRQTTIVCMWTVAFLVQLVLTQFVYERWLFSKRASLVTSAQPQFLLSTVGWFLLSVLGLQTDIESSWGGLPLPAYCLGAGLLLYVIAVIAIINRLHLTPTAKGSAPLTLLIAPPSVGVVALDLLQDDPDSFSPLAAALLGWCLVVFLLLVKLGPRIADKPPSLGAYWAYVFPLAALASATLRNSSQTPDGVGPKALAVIFVCIATLALSVVLARMIAHMVYTIRVGGGVWGDPLVVMRYKNAEKENAPCNHHHHDDDSEAQSIQEQASEEESVSVAFSVS